MNFQPSFVLYKGLIALSVSFDPGAYLGTQLVMPRGGTMELV
jgi:hypothetical protein